MLFACSESHSQRQLRHQSGDLPGLRLVTFTHVQGTVAKFIGGGMIALQLKERRKSEKVSIPPLCVDTAGICNVSVTFRILDSY